ncbi:MAG: sporulation initiation factor Spo0A C-terminal domain-containing protein [Lachnospiraceae bacterium]|jgi:two-component system response regulator (stage 0 sporulation protein A)|nr:sporulation initiation factor Spo0A C-terminal domain-containing protein [Lachnospiraceae bacterium]
MSERIKDTEIKTLNVGSKNDLDEWEIYKEITGIMHTFGIPANIKGFKYIRYAVCEAAKTPQLLIKITKNLYLVVATHHNTTWKRVERAIRTAIECVVPEERTLFAELFPSSIKTGKTPTNSEFLARLIDNLRLKYGLS